MLWIFIVYPQLPGKNYYLYWLQWKSWLYQLDHCYLFQFFPKSINWRHIQTAFCVQKKRTKPWRSEEQFTDSEHTWGRTANKSFLFLGNSKSPGCWYPQKNEYIDEGILYRITPHHPTCEQEIKKYFIALATKLDSYWMFSRVKIHVQLWHTTVGLMSLSSFDLRVTYSMRFFVVPTLMENKINHPHIITYVRFSLAKSLSHILVLVNSSWIEYSKIH